MDKNLISRTSSNQPGPFRLGMSWNNLQRYLPDEYETEQRQDIFVVKTPALELHVDAQTQLLKQITLSSHSYDTNKGTDNFLKGDIVPGRRIGIFRLGMVWDDLQPYLLDNYEIEQRHGCFVVKTPSLWLFIDDQTQAVNQIMVLDGFEGKIYNKVGIGSTLTDVKSTLGLCLPDEYPNLYTTPMCPGVSFFPTPPIQGQPWSELAPIIHISIHKIKTNWL